MTGTFGSLTNFSLPFGFADSLSYDPTHAYLNLALSYSGLNNNQRSVANTLSNYFNTTGQIPTVFGSLTPSRLTQASGEVATGVQMTDFAATNDFLRTLLGGGGTDFVGPAGPPSDPGNGALFYTDPTPTFAKSPAIAAMPNGPPPPMWSVWAQAYGGWNSIGGNSFAGSSAVSSQAYGVGAGTSYHVGSDTTVGFGLGGGGTHFNLADGLGSGHSDLMQIGVYGVHHFGSAYVDGALAYGWQNQTTNRSAPVTGDQLRANFDTNTFGGRLEAGDRFATGVANITPYAAAQFASLLLPAYSERSLVGGVFALSYASQTVTDTRTELGAKIDRSFPMATSILTLGGKIAWVHDFNSQAVATAAFIELPTTSFRVNGATPTPDSALVSANAKVKWNNGFEFETTFDGDFSNRTHGYDAHGTLTYRW